jgi:hypothetical protein
VGDDELADVRCFRNLDPAVLDAEQGRLHSQLGLFGFRVIFAHVALELCSGQPKPEEEAVTY